MKKLRKDKSSKYAVQKNSDKVLDFEIAFSSVLTKIYVCLLLLPRVHLMFIHLIISHAYTI